MLYIFTLNVVITCWMKFLIEEYSCMYDVGTLLHNLLFSYQKAAKEVLGDGHEVIYHPTLDLLLKIEERAKLKLASAKTLDEALTNFSTFLIKAQVLQNFAYKKSLDGKYSISVEGCVWAKHIHHELEPENVICPWAMIAMALVQKFEVERLKENGSTYSPDGSETVIEPLRFGFTKEEALKLGSCHNKIC
jgi:hypothetical protein